MPNFDKAKFDSRLRHAAIWTSVEMVTMNLVSILTVVLLARNLAPAEFGILAPIYLITTLISGFVDGGMSGAIIRFQNLSEQALSSIFWLILILAACGAFILVLISPFLGKYYEHPELKYIALVFSFNILIGSLAAVPKALLAKKFNNKKSFNITFVASIISSAIAILMAYSGYGVWSIVTQLTVYGIIQTVGSAVSAAWRPSLIFSLMELRACLSYGYYFTALGYLNGLYRYAASALLGKHLGFNAAGIYAQSDRIQQILSDQLISITQRIAFPLFSSISHHKEELQAAYLKGYRLLTAVSVPIMFGLASTAEVLVPTVFGNQWIPGVPVLQVLCIAGLVVPAEVYDQMVIKSVGSASTFFRLEIIKRIVALTVVVLAIQSGMVVTALAFSAMAILGFLANSLYVDRLINVRLFSRLAVSWKSYTSGLIMAIAVTLVATYLPAHGLILLCTQVIFGATIYIGSCWLLMDSTLIDAIKYIKNSPSIN